MFKFLKDKLKKSVNKLSEDIEKEAKEETLTEEEVVQEEKKKPGFFSKLFKKKEKKETVLEEYEPEELFDDKKVEEDIKEEYEEVVHEAPKQEVTAEKVIEKVQELKEKEEAEEEKVVEEKIEKKKVKEEREEKKKVKKEEKTEKEEKREIKEEITEEIEKPKEVEKKPTAAELVEEAEKEVIVKELKKDIKDAKKEIKEAYVDHSKEQFEKAKEKIVKVKEEIKDIVEKEEKDVVVEKLQEKADEIEKDIKKDKKVIKDLEPEEEGKGFFGKLKQKIVTKKINAKQFDELFWDMELVLLENNVAVEVIDKIKSDLKEFLVDRPIRRGKVADTIMSSLRHSLESLFEVEKVDLLKRVKAKKPYVICFVGINGSGKTTTIGKMCQLFKNQGLKCVMAAADTFRAAAIQQLEEHANNLGVKIIKHDYGSDAAAVAFDAVKYATAHHIDVVLVDTAGRMHSNANLVDEMKKIIRVATPDLKIFVGESITGNDCVEQASKFDAAIGIDGIVLSKADVDDKGGAAVSVSYVTKKPILYLGTGQRYEDLQEFDSSVLLEGLDL
ncbi:MAG: signal recognition particle-docking protein FtsY [Nanoarchaeota archaeon]|nr:signal recognition particle-docking protein FtsY [Nanoarchaeota archaeon]